MWMIVMSAIIAGVILLDQVSKALVVAYLYEGQKVLIPGLLQFTYVENRGMAFGLLSDHRWVFLVLSTLGILAIGYYLFRYAKTTLFRVSLSLIVGGGIGNMIDRVALGYVVDMIDFRLIHFAVFNVADSFVCVGAGMLMLYLILSMRREVLAERAAAAAQPQDPAEEAHPDAPAPDETAADTTAPEGQRSDTTDSRFPTDRPPDGGAPDA